MNEKNKIKKLNPPIIVGILIAVILLTILLTSIKPIPGSTDDSSVSSTTEDDQPHNNAFHLANYLLLTAIESYTGPFVEDGSNEEVADILMIKVKNAGKDAIEYAVIQARFGDTIAEFTLSALMPGEEAILLEKNRMPYDPSTEYDKNAFTCTNLAPYQYELSKQEDRIKVQVLDGVVNVTNISREDIADKVMIYYKNKKDGVYLGGIAYRITIEDGIKAGEIRQKMAGHVSASDSVILFVTITK